MGAHVALGRLGEREIVTRRPPLTSAHPRLDVGEGSRRRALAPLDDLSALATFAASIGDLVARLSIGPVRLQMPRPAR